ncbi:MAG TPA: hypothetical protein VGG63_14245 [Steroidobacteraceae bacterium]|jgi:hypothetical protein
MRKTYPMVLIMCAAIAVGGTGCAQPPVKRPSVKLDALAKQLGVSTSVLELALRAGYTTEIEGGKTLFCRHDEHTGSMVPILDCEDAARLRGDLQTRQQFVNEVHQQVSQTAIQPTPKSPR